MQYTMFLGAIVVALLFIAAVFSRALIGRNAGCVENYNARLPTSLISNRVARYSLLNTYLRLLLRRPKTIESKGGTNKQLTISWLDF